MNYTVLAARFANEDHSAAIIHTAEAADVLVSQMDTPDIWEQMLAWGAPEPYVAPAPQPFDPIDELVAFLNRNPDVRALILAEGSNASGQ